MRTLIAAATVSLLALSAAQAQSTALAQPGARFQDAAPGLHSAAPAAGSAGSAGLNSAASPAGAGGPSGVGATSGADAPNIAGAKLESVWDFVVKGGPTMIAIVLCSLLALAIVVERVILLRRGVVLPPALIPAVRAMGGDSARALEHCRSDGSALAGVVAAAIKRRGASREAMAASVEEVGRREVFRLRQRMRVLGSLPQVSTMLGLLGTIFGMIKTFQAVAASGQSLGKTELLARGIFEAWTNTAAGLLVAIPVMIAYQALLGRIDGLMIELDRLAEEFVEAEFAPIAAAGAFGTSPASAPASAAVQIEPRLGLAAAHSASAAGSLSAASNVPPAAAVVAASPLG